MTDDVIIRAEGLGKKYVIGHQNTERYTALRDVMAQAARNFARTTRDMLRGKALVSGDLVEEFWALKDVNFEIKRGDVVGIIGRNGAGKSTLLKVLSRITEPSEGRVKIRGRVSSLLEVGTGFHPELTGRENIYLNGAILGMGRTEIRRKFDEIVAFSEVERFLDTPVKRYSSGMYVRLAFAVAAHLEPDILVIDEVLAVGDLDFQRKCLGKMEDVANHGRTVLFVSHDLSAVSALCKRVLQFARGSVVFDGLTDEAIDHYRTGLQKDRINTDGHDTSESMGHRLHVTSFTSDAILSSTELNLEWEMEITSKSAYKGAINVFIRDEVGRSAGAFSVGGLGSSKPFTISEGTSWSRIRVKIPRLAQGHYSFDIEIADRLKNRRAMFPHAIAFESFPTADPQCSEVLKQAWGFGCIWPEIVEVTQNAKIN